MFWKELHRVWVGWGSLKSAWKKWKSKEDL